MNGLSIYNPLVLELDFFTISPVVSLSDCATVQTCEVVVAYVAVHGFAATNFDPGLRVLGRWGVHVRVRAACGSLAHGIGGHVKGLSSVEEPFIVSFRIPFGHSSLFLSVSRVSNAAQHPD